MQVRFIPGAREKETGKESSNRTENRYWCPSLRRRRCVGRIRSREFGKLAPYLRYAIESACAFFPAVKGCLLPQLSWDR
jgi:hypothetical protein